MFGFGKKDSGPSFDDVAGIILSEMALARILQPKFDRRIMHLSRQDDKFTLDFDPNDTVNAYVLGDEDVVKILRDYYRRTVIEVVQSEEGHGMYLVRFQE
jgi:hypothetical protein